MVFPFLQMKSLCTILLFQGTYISWFTGELIKGPMTVNRTFTLSEIPVFVRAGSIIPLRTDGYNNGMNHMVMCMW